MPAYVIFLFEDTFPWSVANLLLVAVSFVVVFASLEWLGPCFRRNDEARHEREARPKSLKALKMMPDFNGVAFL